MMKKIFICLIFTFCFMRSVNATCNYSTISRMRKLASNVNLSYSYNMFDGYPSFKVTINNITSDMYLLDNSSGKIYNYTDTNNGELVIENYSFYDNSSYIIYSSQDDCYGKELARKYYSFPVYNYYYNDEECKGAEEAPLCQKWISQNVNYNSFIKNINEYKQSKPVDEEISDNTIITEQKNSIDKFLVFYAKYYYFILIFIILICSSIIIYQNRKNKFKL